MENPVFEPGHPVPVDGEAAGSDQARHLDAIEALAGELARPAEEIAKLYDLILEDYRAVAVVMDYLPVLVAKKVKGICRRP